MIYVVYFGKKWRKEFRVLKEAKIFAEQQGVKKIIAYSVTGVLMYVLVHEDWLVDGGTWVIEGTLT